VAGSSTTLSALISTASSWRSTSSDEAFNPTRLHANFHYTVALFGIPYDLSSCFLFHHVIFFVFYVSASFLLSMI
jgi:hypothetical protein